ncbi:MAG: membrane protein insertase YidC [Acidimicrobiia bacterium]|nr:membrane protein insertase YidC [Acidimicrobiia bacterium]
MFDAFFNAIAGLLAWFYELPVVGGSYGGAIVLLTLTVMIIVTPLTLKGTRSMMTMQALGPEMKKIQQQHADDRVKMNEELLAFYKENKINPVGSCLPLVLQMPVFIILYQVINGLTRISDGTFDPKYISHDSALYQALTEKSEMVSWGLDLSRAASKALQVSFVEGLPYIALIVAVAATSYIQQKQISGRNPNAEMPQQQKILLRVMPVFFAFISFNFAAALVIYFFVSNLYRIGQQAYISKAIYGAGGVGAAPATIDTTATESTRKSRPESPKATSKDAAKKDSAKKGDPGTTGSSAPRRPRPPSGRVTPPKGSGGATSPGGAPARRKKKRS